MKQRCGKQRVSKHPNQPATPPFPATFVATETITKPRLNHHRTNSYLDIMALEREDAIANAINAIRDGQVRSVRAAARAYGIPRSTLQDRLHGATDHSMASETTQKLTSEQEKCLVEWIKELETHEKAPSHTMVREMACRIIDSETLGRTVYTATPWRHILHWGTIRVCQSSKLHLDIIAEHFRRVQNLIQSHDILSDDIWNTDETGIAVGLRSNGYVISGKGKRRVYVKAPQNREWMSIVEAISAGGRSTRPLVVFKGQNLHSSWFPEVDVPDWHYTTSENGWTSNKKPDFNGSETCLYRNPNAIVHARGC